MERTKHWLSCPTCKLVVFAKSLGEHECPDKIKAKHDAELDMWVDDFMITWDEDVRKFWNSNDVRFWQEKGIE